MGENLLTAVYFCGISNEHAEIIDIAEVAAYTKTISLVGEIWHQKDFPVIDPDEVAAKIRGDGIKRIVITGYQPGMFKSFFTKAMVQAGNDPGDVFLACFGEFGAYKRADTERAKAILACAIYGVSFEEAASPEEVDTSLDTLVIGGGIAGIQASLEIANGNQKVYLVERTGTIGGHMAMFDKTFPTLDCAACILTPKMVEVGQHPNIDLMTYCEVKDVTGEPGNYKVKILQKARRVDLATCIGCGTCSEKCPRKAVSEFDADTTLRKAIYIPFPQAVPNKYLIDADNCTYVENGKCGVCAKVCPVPDCINLDEQDELVEVTVGNIIVATGFKVFDAKRIERYGYGKYPNVVTSLEFERLVNAAGPTSGDITFRTQDKKKNWIFAPEGNKPKSIALIHCIGSRDENYHKYCSKVCCMYSLKLAHLVKEKLPDAEVYEYYIDMRSFGKGYQEFYERIKNEGVNIIRGRTAKIDQDGDKLLLRSEDIVGDRLIEQSVDMAILAVGLEPREDTTEIGEMLGISIDSDGWFNEVNYVSDPVDTFTGGITVAGVCQGPKDIPDTVAQASAAASRVLQSILKGKIRKSIKELSLESIEKRAKELSIIMEGQL
ncbi:MAG: CoB--CoM heterodisulfide reductase iron-sulfur subunit A family protein [Bacteroidales bacterium]|nr:CoB--CoM heterodisulfide reductase iron-sulfur subunit A family protein [Bacteroidales bacterium]